MFIVDDAHPPDDLDGPDATKRPANALIDRGSSRSIDAQHNRDRILEVARDAFAASGEVSLNSIAKKAGVGPGTLYRHFPNREALVLAVYRHDVQQLVDAAPALLKHGLADVLHAATSDGLVGETYGPVIGAITLLLWACAEAGDIRPGHDPDDVLLILGFLWRIAPSHDWEVRAARMLDIVMAGLRARAP